MYTLECRVYVINGVIHTAGEYRRNYAGDEEILARSSRVSPKRSHPGPTDHHEILTEAVRFCEEIAQKLDVPLF